MNDMEAIRRLGAQIPAEVVGEAADRLRRDVRRRMFKRGLFVMSTRDVDECIEVYNETIDTCRRKGSGVRRISVASRAKRGAPCYGILLDWVASDGQPLPKLVVLEQRGHAPVMKVDVVVTPPVVVTVRGEQPCKAVGQGTEFMHMMWNFK